MYYNFDVYCLPYYTAHYQIADNKIANRVKFKTELIYNGTTNKLLDNPQFNMLLECQYTFDSYIYKGLLLYIKQLQSEGILYFIYYNSEDRNPTNKDLTNKIETLFRNRSLKFKECKCINLYPIISKLYNENNVKFETNFLTNQLYGGILDIEIPITFNDITSRAINTVSIKMYNIIDIKYSIIGLMEQVSQAIWYSQNYHRLIDFLVKIELFDLNRSAKSNIVSTSTDILYSNNFINAISTKFKNTIIDENNYEDYISKLKIDFDFNNNVKVLNVKGNKYSISDRISITNPSIFDLQNIIPSKLTKFNYLWLQHFNKVGNFYNLIDQIMIGSL